MVNVIFAGILSGSLWQIASNTSTFGIIILLVLLFMSVVSWMIIFFKWRQFKEVEKDTRRFIDQFRMSKNINTSLGQAKSASRSPISNIFMAGYNEFSELSEMKKNSSNPNSGKKLDNNDFEIIEMSMEKTLSEEIGNLEKKVIFLASTANSAPFIGLLGTVVGIMDAFWAIGERGSASLAVVAPGIAEALLATIVGLATAIPAVIAFNWAKNKINILNEGASNFILEFVTQSKKEMY